MKNLEQPELENRFKQIKLRTEEVKLKGRFITQEQLFKDSEREDILFEKFDERTPEEEEEYKALKAKREKSGLIVKTLPEFRYALESLGIYSPEQVADILSHENAHANKMETLGVKFMGYEIVVFKKENGKGGLMFIAISDEFPIDWDIEKKKGVHKKIANAPEEYESSHPLSSFDKAMIDRLSGVKEE